MRCTHVALGIFFTAIIFGSGLFVGTRMQDANTVRDARLRAQAPQAALPGKASEGVPSLQKALPSNFPTDPHGTLSELLPGIAPNGQMPAPPAGASGSPSASLAMSADASAPADALLQADETSTTPKTPTPFPATTAGFSLHKRGPGNGATILVVGGIQGDEPGGFSAAAILATHYKITSGAVWIVPDLNFASILERHRGLFGDMNRKFDTLDVSDPEYEAVERVKSLIVRDEVVFTLNLHDGSGYYRPTHEDALRNPKRWGQSIIIDRANMEAPQFYDLLAMASRVTKDVNSALVKQDHRYYVHNTNTHLGDKEMEKTLSYFAVRNGKPAFGIEASKDFTTEFRSYYHLQAIESFMRQAGITFERDFDLTPRGVLGALNSNLTVAAFNNKLVLPLDNARPSMGGIPFKKDATLETRVSKPLLALVPDESKKNWRVAYGNRTLTRVTPDFMEFDDSLETMDMVLDGQDFNVRIGDIITVSTSFLVKDIPGYRVNAIGAMKDVNGSESGVVLAKKDFLPRHSVDRGATTYRVEVYKKDAFAGMILVRFGKGLYVNAEPLTATKGPESSLGF